MDNDVPVSAALEYGNVTGVTRSLENMEIQEVLVDDDPQETWHIEAAETRYTCIGGEERKLRLSRLLFSYETTHCASS